MSFVVTPSGLNRRAELYNQLGSMLAAGVTLIKTLQMAAKSPAIRGNRKTFLQLVDLLQEGYTFSDSMLRVQGWLAAFDTALLSAGEQSGRLDVSFKLLSNFYATRAAIMTETISAMMKSLLTLGMFLLVFPLRLLVALASGIVNKDFAAALPFILEKILVYGGIVGTILLFMFLCNGRRGAGWRAFLESCYKKIPFLGKALKYLVLSRLAAALDALSNAGVNVTKAWELAAAAGGSQHLVGQVAGWSPKIEAGMTPSELINQTPYFPEMFADLYHTGEISGQIDETLQRLHAYYQEEGFRFLRRFARVVNGVVYGIVVVLVGYNVIRFWMNYYGALLGAN